jgi:hypothetical protein
MLSNEFYAISDISDIFSYGRKLAPESAERSPVRNVYSQIIALMSGVN